jgi:hypothetical protein
MSDSSRLIAIGRLSVPRGWEVRSESTFLAPQQPTQEMPTLRTPEKAPRGNVVISRRPETRALELVVNERRKEVVKLWPNGRVSPVEKHVFDDAAGGLSFDAQFSTHEFGPVLQAHRLRIDDGVATHVVVTVVAADRAKLDSLLEVARTYRPPDGESS